MTLEKIANVAQECAAISALLDVIDEEALTEVVAMGDALVNMGIEQDAVRERVHNLTKMILCFVVEFRKLPKPGEGK